MQFLRQAARDPDVVAIKQTLYRTSDDSPIVAALIEAAEAGKSVTALVELKARFDEEANIRWARDLERAGVQVVYGFIELKTHAKVVAGGAARGRRAALPMSISAPATTIPITAKIYTDLSLLHLRSGAGPRRGAAVQLHDRLCRRRRRWKRSPIAPITLRERLLELIERGDRRTPRAGKPAQIWAKINALVDPGDHRRALPRLARRACRST